MSLKTESYYPSTPNLSLPKEEWHSPNLTWGEKIFLAELRNIQSHYPEGKIPYRSSKLAEHFNVAPLTINKWVKTLTKLGILEVEMTASQNQWEHIISVRS